ncbi:hypothetical protein PoB_004759200 [Plakobranchus ocellatus]|uniref:Uncharacterized protein n=1 Tax=Plakobranchus ocellatus TaxID=259542 RepID=A0AAV4BP11_9GAST|nr:hypothetical protein PoB_004759200 [Plakobranchus ocellatus]
MWISSSSVWLIMFSCDLCISLYPTKHSPTALVHSLAICSSCRFLMPSQSTYESSIPLADKLGSVEQSKVRAGLDPCVTGGWTWRRIYRGPCDNRERVRARGGTGRGCESESSTCPPPPGSGGQTVVRPSEAEQWKLNWLTLATVQVRNNRKFKKGGARATYHLAGLSYKPQRSRTAIS